jgi:hypothetical protein
MAEVRLTSVVLVYNGAAGWALSSGCCSNNVWVINTVPGRLRYI